MNGSMLDTNFIIRMIDKDPVAIAMAKKIKNCYTSFIVVGELYFAAEKSTRKAANFTIFRKILSGIKLIAIDDKVCMSYAEIKHTLREKGKPAPENDLWIAACAYAHDLSVATFDRHFSEISQIKLFKVD
jgi:tRNA(fMet)-specific endonuclease VapC